MAAPDLGAGISALPTLRQRMEAAVETLLAALDVMDGDPDLEPSLGAVAYGCFSDQRRWAQGVSDEREEACEDEGVRPDDEPDAPDGGVDYELHDQTKPGTYSGAPLIDPWRPGEITRHP